MTGLNWSGVTREDVIKAIGLFLKDNPAYTAPRSTFLVYEGKKLPAKHIRGMAYKVAFGREITKDEYSGGIETVRFFERLGFQMRYTGKSMRKEIKPAKETKDTVLIENPPEKQFNVPPDPPVAKTKAETIKIPSKGVIEQKNALRRILNEMFEGDVVCEKVYPWMKTPESIDGIYAKLYKALSSYRGDGKFARKNVALRCDFVIESQKLIIEYDERQHFSEARKISLLSYKDVPVYYDRSLWIHECSAISAKDNQPVNRDETRAYYDSVRDIEAAKNGYQLVRIMHGQLDFEEDSAVVKLKALLASQANKSNGFRVALYLQTSNVRILDSFQKDMDAAKNCNADIFVFPEACYIPFEEELHDLSFFDENDLERMYALCLDFSGQIGKPVVVSNYDKSKALISIYANANPKDGETRVSRYAKHTQTFYSPLGRNDYLELAKDLFELIILKGKKIGLTICYDCNLSAFSRVYGLKGVDLIINSTGGDVVYDKWYKYNQTRAIENHCYELVTMGGDADRKNSKCYVFGFTPNGKEMIPECIGGVDASRNNVCGSIYIYDTNTDDGSDGVDTSFDQSPTTNKYSNLDIPVGNVQSLLDKSEKITDTLFIKNVDGRNVVFVLADAEDILKPEKFLALLYAPDIKKFNNRRYVLINRWKHLDQKFYKAKLSVVLKVRAMENYCAVILESDIENHCYQCGKNRTAQVVKETDGVFKVDLVRTTGSEAIWKTKNGMKAGWRKNYEWLVREITERKV